MHACLCVCERERERERLTSFHETTEPLHLFCLENGMPLYINQILRHEDRGEFLINLLISLMQIDNAVNSVISIIHILICNEI